MIYDFFLHHGGHGVFFPFRIVIQRSFSDEGSRVHPLYVPEILPPFGRLNDKIVSRSISFPYIFSLIFTFINQPAIQTITNENNNERHKPGTPAHKKSG